LHERLRADARVTNLERTNVRHVTADQIGGPVDLAVADLSFISLTAVMPALVRVCQPGATMVLLVKPQFEAGRAEVSRGRGVITDAAVHDRVKGEVADAIIAAGCDVAGWVASPLRGADGNREFLAHVIVGADNPDTSTST
jgi:23S rRNA (cytidine1920-2'-O)/16S rRNA (cytidine1409-2'-O)-methyltransferase